MENPTIRRALLSVYDKTGLVELARALADQNVELLSTGGTRKVLQDEGLHVLDVSEVTSFPEMLDGRVKTLHPRIHGGILGIRRNPEHVATMEKHEIRAIDLVVCNLYPFEATVARPGVTHEEVIENIDIGGPSMIRSASKNFHDVAVLTDPCQYSGFLAEFHAKNGKVSLPMREQLAAAAFARTASYDAAIERYFAGRSENSTFPDRLQLTFDRKAVLRYGENPHQTAAFYAEPAPNPAGIANAQVLHGKELSFNNILDLDSAWNLVREFDGAAAAIIKHNNPCGVGLGRSLADAFANAQSGDPVSAYGGVVALSQVVDEAAALQLTEPNRFLECIIAPGYADRAFEILTTRPTWKKSVRILAAEWSFSRDPSPATLDFRRVEGGLLVQTRDTSGDDFANMRVVTKRQPSPKELVSLRFAWLVCKHVKSNAIVLAQENTVVGVGAGQMSRVDSVEIAARKAGDRVRGSAMASDAFFPFRDNIDVAAKAGVAAIVQPGGSMRDPDSIAACDEHGIAMVLTGIRHFRH
jgi:phosphoribosylaminoimidazolecarboxamide formyltransferase/IMP cyclohydrolase